MNGNEEIERIKSFNMGKMDFKTKMMIFLYNIIEDVLLRKEQRFK